MKRKYIVIMASVVLWAFVGWRTASLVSAKFGPVSVRWTKLDEPISLMAWSPHAADYTFSSHHLVLNPDQTATVVVRLIGPWRSAKLSTSSQLTVQAGQQRSTGSQTFSFSAVPHTASGYLIQFTNSTAKTITLASIDLTLRP